MTAVRGDLPAADGRHCSCRTHPRYQMQGFRHGILSRFWRPAAFLSRQRLPYWASAFQVVAAEDGRHTELSERGRTRASDRTEAGNGKTRAEIWSALISGQTVFVMCAKKCCRRCCRDLAQLSQCTCQRQHLSKGIRVGCYCSAQGQRQSSPIQPFQQPSNQSRHSQPVVCRLA
jgi:hypothetical protein